MNYTSQVPLLPLLSVESVCAAHRTLLKGKTVIGERHDFYELVYVEDGFYYVILDGTRYTVPPGSFIVFPPNAYHSGDGVTDNTATVSIVAFESATPQMASFGGRVITPGPSGRERLAAVFSLAFSCIESCEGGCRATKEATPVALSLLKNALEAFLLEHYREVDVRPLSGRKRHRKEQFGRLSDYLGAHLSEKLTLDAIAAACLLSRTALKALCREFCGCGVIDYLISLRIDKAKEMIAEGKCNLTEIAEAVGFDSLHYFSRTFKARCGIPPSQYAAEE